MSIITIKDLYRFEIMGDEQGSLVPIEGNIDIPFEIKRVFYIYETSKDAVRGKHARYKTQEIIICIHGSCKIDLFDGYTKKTYTLDKPYIGLFQDAMVWGEIYDFSKDCVLLVLADTYYNESDYIRDFNRFLKEIEKRK